MKATNALLQFFDAQNRKDHSNLQKAKINLNAIFEQKKLLLNAVSKQGRSGLSEDSPVFSMLVFLLESIAYELNIEKPDHEKVDQLY